MNAGNTLVLKRTFPASCERVFAMWTTEELVKTWSEGEDSFAKNPPNATLSFLGKGELEDVVVVLRDPQLVLG